MEQQTGIGEEMRKIAEEPLLPVEKRLIGWSLVTGAVLMVILVLVSYTDFPAAG